MRRALTAAALRQPALPRLRPFVRCSSSFYDSQSGRTVTVPTGVQCHVSLSSVATERHPAALKHLIKSGKAVRGVASVMRALDGDVAAVTDATSGASTTLCIAVSDLADGVAAVKAASEREMRSLALLSSELCADDPYAVQLAAAELVAVVKLAVVTLAPLAHCRAMACSTTPLRRRSRGSQRRSPALCDSPAAQTVCAAGRLVATRTWT